MKSETVAASTPVEAPTRSPRSPKASPPPILNRGFALLCLVAGLGYFHFGLLGPILPLYVSSLGYSEVVIGLVVAAFAFSSFAIRPLLGYLADHWSVRGVQTGGLLCIGLAATAFLAPFLLLIALLNFIRGAGWAAFNTGANTLLAHTAPDARRAEAAGYLALFHNGPSMMAAPLALWILALAGGEFGVVILIAAGIAFAAAALSLAIPAPATHDHSGGASTAPAAAPASGLARFFDRGVLLPTVLLVCMQAVNPAIQAFAALYALTLNISLESLAWYYIASGITSLIGRPLFGRLSDRIGRRASLVAGFSLATVGLILHAAAFDVLTLTLAVTVYTLGTAMHQPSTMALAMDRADPRRRGRAMASFSLGNQLGAAIGAPLAGAIAQFAGYSSMYTIMVVGPFVGLMVIAANWQNLRGGAAHAGH